MTVVGVLCLVDREQGGRLRIERALAEVPTSDDAEVPFLSVFTAADVRRAHVALRGGS
jgi:orotate phosphoribosyltransferase